jgi:type VI secretion system protein ImpF
VAELTLNERLQPSLIDRLRDDEPDKTVESRAQRVLSINRLRRSVQRDLGWLLNCGNLEVTEDLDDYPEVAKSVLNYGVPDLTGSTTSSIDVSFLERQLRTAILNFEPRLLADALKVTAEIDPQKMSRNAMSFLIQGQLWAQPLPISLFLSTELDFETGSASLAEVKG